MASDIDWETALGVPSDLLDDDIKGTDELKLSNRLYKTEEEIDRFTVDESLGDVDRAILLLRFKPAQRSKRPVSLCRYLISFRNITRKLGHEFYRLYCKDQETVDVWAEVVIAAIKSIALETIENEILPEVLLDTKTAQPAPVRLWCCRVLGAVSERLDGRRIEELFFRKAMALCQDTDYEVRVSMCNQLNAIARGVGLPLTKNELLPEYMELLMDEEDIVREAAIENLMQLMDFLDADAKTIMVIPLWRKLCDERSAGILTLIAKEFGGFMWASKDHMSDSDWKFFLTFYQSLASSTVPKQREMCAFNFPAIVCCVGIEGYDRYKLGRILDSLALDDCKVVRRRMAGGLHEVATLLGSTSYANLKSVFLRLLGDHEVDVFHALIKNLDVMLNCFAVGGRKPAYPPHQPLDDLLPSILRRERDCFTSSSPCGPASSSTAPSSASSTPSSFLSQSPASSQSQIHLLSSSSSTPSSSTTSLNFHSFKANTSQTQSSLQHQPPLTMKPGWCNWRVHRDLLSQFENFTEYFDSDLLFEQCVPVLFKLVTGNLVAPVKETVVRCLCQFLRRLRRNEYRERVFRQLQDDLKSSPTYSHRLLYIKFLSFSLITFSTAYFRSSLLPTLLDMTKDPVPNIRLAIVQLLPNIRKIIRIPADSDLLHQLTEVLGEFATDGDGDVGRGAEEVFKGFGGTVGGGKGIASRAAAAARVGAGAGNGGVGIIGAIGGGNSADSRGSVTTGFLPPEAGGMTSVEEAEDKAKEEEERQMLHLEWESEEAAKRRDMEEARQEFSRRLAEKDLGKKSGGVGFKGKGGETVTGMKGRGGGATSVGGAQAKRRASGMGMVGGDKAGSGSPPMSGMERSGSGRTGSFSGNLAMSSASSGRSGMARNATSTIGAVPSASILSPSELSKRARSASTVTQTGKSRTARSKPLNAQESDSLTELDALSSGNGFTTSNRLPGLHRTTTEPTSRSFIGTGGGAAAISAVARPGWGGAGPLPTSARRRSLDRDAVTVRSGAMANNVPRMLSPASFSGGYGLSSSSSSGGGTPGSGGIITSVGAGGGSLSTSTRQMASRLPWGKTPLLPLQRPPPGVRESNNGNGDVGGTGVGNQR
ncbi:Serine/threonine-protein phosphatase 4 regulatory subunit 4 [Rhizophlyctis rosea]|nr:Serine/threonine-protein phosphatase 4 regulatory subunit 4 [Rhizophlyctis rosea]